MAFLKKPLKWTALGQEPSELKKSEGFKMDESPAPGHFDFMFRSTYEAIEELQQKAGEVKTVNNVQPDINGNVLITLPDTSKLYQKPTSGIPKADLDATVQTSLEKADNAAPTTELAKTNQTVAAHQADNVSHDTYVSCVTTGATAEKIVTVNGFSLVEGARITVKFANANTATVPTLKINTELAKPLVKADGTAFKNIKAGIYSFVYSGSNFTVQGEGGEYGTATASEVLQGYTLGTENGVVNGVFSSLKSKQSGIVSLSATDTFIDVNISAVNISKSILDVSCSPGNSNETTHATMAVKIEFINTNTIRLTRAKASTSTSNIIVSWIVYEFNNVKSLQRGSKTLAATTYNDVSISAVNINKSMIFISYTDTMNATIQSSYITRYFGSSSLITFHCTQPTDKIINWQVIEFY